MIKIEPSEDTDVISYVSFLYRKRSTSCTFSLIWNCVYVFRIPAEILEQTRSPASGSPITGLPASRAVACIPGQPLQATRAGSWLLQKTVSRNPRTHTPFVTHTQTGSYWTGRAPRNTALGNRKAIYQQGPAPSSAQSLPPRVCFSWIKVTLINIIYMNNSPLMSNYHMAK